MTKYQEEYIKLISERFEINGKTKRASYKRWENTIDSGIIIELKSRIPNPKLVFISDIPRNYFIHGQWN